MIRFIELLNETNFNPKMERTSTPRFSVGEVWISQQYVVSIREAHGYKKLLKEGLLPGDLDSNHRFTAVTVNNGTISETHIVVGSPETVASRLNRNTSQLLKG
jgi:hypothetical protein|tara:strand:- start:9893 stop:10201 length:309 start_codon:yes stop_codon:yes gene_type:complete